MQIHAIANQPSFNIAAAMQSPEVRAVKSLMASADLRPLGKMSIAEIDRKLSASRLSIQQRLRVKIALDRAGMIED
jgi:hypothetical protein